LRKRALAVFLLRFIRLAFAILNMSLSAKYFGISLERDVWLLALNSIMLFDMAIWGPINETFRAKFLFIREEEGEEKALDKARAVFLFTNFAAILLVGLIMIFPHMLAKLLAPSYESHQLVMLTMMIRVVAPTFLINQLTKLLIAVLNAYSSFIIPEITGIITQITTLVLVILLAPSIGIISLAISYYFGLILLLVMLLIQIKRLNIGFFKGILRSKLITASAFLIYSAPFFFPYFAAQLNAVVEKSIASSLEIGSVSVIDYARKFSDIPLEVLVSTIGTLLVPLLSSQFAQNNKVAFSDEFRKIYQLGILILMIVIGLLSSCPQAFINMLYDKGGIVPFKLIQISNMTMLYSWAMFSVFHYQIFGAALLSVKKGKFYAFFGIIAQFIMIILNLVLYKKMGIYIFPITLFVSHFISAVLMFIKIPFLGSNTKKAIIRYPAILLGICCIMFAANYILIKIPNDLILIIANFVLISVLMMVSLIVFRLEERNWLRYLYRMISVKK
jgi:peptidoglycan biosynthesis protein MviN/MurJ (putative lipid II flippase)